MREPVKKINLKSLTICIVLLVSVFLVEIICAYAFGDGFSFRKDSGSQGGDFSELLAEYEALGVSLDPNAVPGMIDQSEETGTKKPRGTVAYKINPEPQFQNGTEEGNLQIENHADNQHLIKVRIELESGEVVYESGFIGPNMHIPKATLDVVMEEGEYPALVYIDVYELDEEQTFIAQLPKEQKITLSIKS